MEQSIFALSTPPGIGAIAIIRISGEGILEKLLPYIKLKKINSLSHIVPRYAYYCSLFSEKINEIKKTNSKEEINKFKIDDLIFIYFKKPDSYTGEDLIELQIHGSEVIIKLVFNLLYKLGFRMAKPGEFTKIAFINGKFDLLQAEAINNLINAKTILSHKLAIQNVEKRFSKKIDEIKKRLLYVSSFYEAILDYPEEEDFELDLNKEELLAVLDEVSKLNKILLKNSNVGLLLNSNVKTVILGKTNVGKSSFFNLLLEKDRAIVSDIHGTTRDFIEGFIKINEIPVQLFDTAGIRETKDKIEKIGIKRVFELLKNAELLLYIISPDILLEINDIKFLKDYKDKLVIIINKKDLLKKDLLKKDLLKKNLSKNNSFQKTNNNFEDFLQNFLYNCIDNIKDIYNNNVNINNVNIINNNNANINNDNIKNANANNDNINNENINNNIKNANISNDNNDNVSIDNPDINKGDFNIFHEGFFNKCFKFLNLNNKNDNDFEVFDINSILNIDYVKNLLFNLLLFKIAGMEINKDNIIFIETLNQKEDEINKINEFISRKLFKDILVSKEIPYVQSVREQKLLESILDKLENIKRLIKNNTEYDIIAFELREILLDIYNLTGENYNENLYDTIFSNFCLGK